MTIDDKHCKPGIYISRVVQNDLFEEPMSYSKIQACMKEFDVGFSHKLWDRDDGHLCKFGIIENEVKNKLCLFFVGSHTVFDGCTLYNIWKQLDLTQPVRALNPQRAHGFTSKLQKDTSILPTGMDMKTYSVV